MFYINVFYIKHRRESLKYLVKLSACEVGGSKQSKEDRGCYRKRKKVYGNRPKSCH